MTDFIRYPGRLVLRLLEYLGGLGMLGREVVISIFAGKRFPRLLGEQLVSIGYGSQAVIIVTGAFTGAVFAAQSFFQFQKYGVESTVGALVSVAMARELGPVLTGLMVAGRVGASMAAEIGTMKVTEQIDALRSMAVHPVDYLVVPRLAAMMISMPLLIAESITFGILASYVMAVHAFRIEPTWFLTHLRAHTDFSDIFIGMTKGFFFGVIITLISCWQGLNARNGAVGVGQGTTSAVVESSLLILIVNFFLTMLLNQFYPLGV